MSTMLRRFIGDFITVEAYDILYTGRMMGFDSEYICIQQFNDDGSHLHYMMQPLREVVRIRFGGEDEKAERLKTEYFKNTKQQIESVFNDHSD